MGCPEATKARQEPRLLASEEVLQRWCCRSADQGDPILSPSALGAKNSASMICPADALRPSDVDQKGRAHTCPINFNQHYADNAPFLKRARR